MSLKIGDYLRLGRGEDRSGGRSKSALLVNALEAIIAALYLDAGLEAAQRFILRHILEPELAEVHEHGGRQLPVMDYKSALQEAVHASGRPQPRYVHGEGGGPGPSQDVHHGSARASLLQAPMTASFAAAKAAPRRPPNKRAARLAWERLQSLKSSSAAERPCSGRPRLPSIHE